MFEDIENWLSSKNKKPLKKDEKPEIDGIFSELGLDKISFKEEDHSGHDHPPMEEIAKIMKEKFGASKVEIVPGGMIVSKTSITSGVNTQEDNSWQIERLKARLGYSMDVLRSCMIEMKLKPFCTDANDTKLKVGDVLYTSEGDKKTVMELGFGYAYLSRTDDQEDLDGVWFIPEIKSRKLIKK